jgi:hypothetical protein
LIERYQGQDIVESLSIIAAIFVIGGGLLFSMIWEPDPVQPAIAAEGSVIVEPPVNITTTTTIPTPIPTPDYSYCDPRDNCYHLKEWRFWFKPDVQGINGQGTKDLRTWATVYGYKYLPFYHWQSVMWGSRTFFKETPPYGMKFLFVFINIYSDGDDVRQYGYESNHFTVQVKDRLFYEDEAYEKTVWIKELQETWDYAHVEAVKPWGYRIVQDRGTGVIRAEKLDFIMGGRSNAWDGFIVFLVPEDSNPENTKVLARFDNLGGYPYWSLS